MGYKSLKTYLFIFLFVLYSATLVSAKENESQIEIVYHIATINNWKDIVNEQLTKVEKSGLGDACDHLTISITGSHIAQMEKILNNYSFKNKVSYIKNLDLSCFEFPAIEKVIQIAKEKPTAKILYFHTKGVTYHNQPNEKNITLWRKYMDYFNLEKWDDCILALEDHDACGVEWTESACGVYMFAGNFWWGRADYINTCILYKRSRYDCEIFIGTGDQPHVKIFHLSGENPKLKHHTYQKNSEFFHFPPSSPVHKGIMNLLNFSYIEKYYRDDVVFPQRNRQRLKHTSK